MNTSHSPCLLLAIAMLEEVVSQLKPDDSRIETLDVSNKEEGISALFLHVNCSEDYASGGGAAAREETFAFRGNTLRDVINSGEMIATYRWKIFWLNSKVCKSEGCVPPECYFLLMRQKNNKYFLFTPLVDGDTLFSLEGCKSTQRLLLHSFNDKKEAKKEEGQSSSDKCKNVATSSKKALLISEGVDLFDLVAFAMSIVKDISKEQLEAYGYKCNDEDRGVAVVECSNPKRRGPDFINYLAWSTWDAFYTGVSSDKLVDGLQSFVKVGRTPRTIIIDDGWQSSNCVDFPNKMQWAGRLESFDANYKFNVGGSVSIETETLDTDIEIEGWGNSSDDTRKVGHERDHTGSLENLIAYMKERCGVKYCLLWHALTGYWAGVQGSEFEEKYNSSLAYASLSQSAYRMSPGLRSDVFQRLGVGLVCAHRAGSFFGDYHRAMRAMGVDGVKVDAQAIVASILPAEGGMSSTELSFRFQIALKRSVEGAFCDVTPGQVVSYPLIHCMCHAYPNLMAILGLYSDGCPVGSKPRVVVRASDDYWPDDDRSHGPHVYAATFNSLLLGCMGVVDWDMFQTHNSAAATGGGRTSEKAPLLHACARAVSGGPVTVSDRPHEHDDQLLARLVLPGGRVPLCSASAMPVEKWLFVDPASTANTPLVVQNINGQHSKVVAAFHVLGSRLANDSDNFVFLHPSEIDWRDGDVQAYACKDDKSSSGGGNPALLQHSKLLSDETYKTAMEIHFEICESDLRQAKGGSGSSIWDGCIVHRMSDGVVLDTDSVSVHLREIFDCDVITFARKYFINGIYVAALGDLSLLNPGGCVTSLSVSPGSKDGTVCLCMIEVLCDASVSIVTNSAAACVVNVHVPVHDGGVDSEVQSPFGSELMWQGCLRCTERCVGDTGRELLLALPQGGAGVGAESVVFTIALTAQ